MKEVMNMELTVESISSMTELKSVGKEKEKKEGQRQRGRKKSLIKEESPQETARTIDKHKINITI